MKSPTLFQRTKIVHRSVCFQALFLGAMLCCGPCVLAQEANVQTTATLPGTTNPALVTNRPPARPLSPGVNEILKMADAGVSAEVIRTYVECSPIPYQPTDVDIIVLKKHNVADEVVTLMLKRGAQVRAAIAQARNNAFAMALSARKMASGGLDPDSYEYFQHYYLQPRALASAYERLAPYYPYSPYPYGYAPGQPPSGGPAMPR